MIEYKVKVRITTIASIPSLHAKDGDDCFDKVVREEGYDKNEIEDLQITDMEVEPLEAIPL